MNVTAKPDEELRECHCVLCVQSGHMRNPDAPVVVGKAQAHGWWVQGVLGDEQAPPWAYTVGLWHTFGHPELVLCGLGFAVSGPMLNALGEAVRRGDQLKPLGRIGDEDHSAPFALAEVNDNWYPDLLTCIPDFYQGRPPAAFQVIWADRNEVFPWEPGFNNGDRDRQPSLWLPKDSHPFNVWRRLDDLSGECPGGGCDCADQPG